MTYDETRDNTATIEAQLIEADSHEDDLIEYRIDIRRSKPFMGDYLPEQDDPEDPEHDPIGDAETEHDIEYDDEPEDDGQPSEYEEWQDYMGGDDWDFGQYDQGGY
jgi:hypothetical protein